MMKKCYQRQEKGCQSFINPFYLGFTLKSPNNSPIFLGKATFKLKLKYP